MAKDRKATHGRLLALLGIAMLGAAFGFVPLYRHFCKLIGTVVVENGAPVPTPAELATLHPVDRYVTVRFMGAVGDGLPVRFGPEDKALKAQVGKAVVTAFDAYNYSDKAIKGMAVHTVTGTGAYGATDVAGNIVLTQCFCFTSHMYPADSKMRLPVIFTVKPDLPEGIHTITFGYTLYGQD